MTTIGVMLCDHVAPELEPIAGGYPDMFARMFRVHPDVRLQFYDATAGHYPAAPNECDGYLTTGSAGSVNEDAEWVDKFEEFVRLLHAERAKLFGICFGHQMIAKALGGEVHVADQGWGVGVHEVTIVEHQPWMDPRANSYQVISSHQEQITKLPVGATVLASTPHCPVAMFRCGSLVGIQGHPEFPCDYAAALLETRASIIPPDVSSTAASSFASQPDANLLSAWIVRYVAGVSTFE
ncbi:MAG: hypothetical protein CL790_04400 [Chloroflexi bacterium]|nr:hypothetical protein [Chloroflexota bacterium]|tara:strand:- start:4581 stop:5294 length:714 start_codon:yes stop_codon:yes gene_type:complete